MYANVPTCSPGDVSVASLMPTPRCRLVAVRRIARDAERGRFGQAEVEHLHASARGHEDVGRLDVPVNDAALVCRTERVEHLHADLGHPPRRHRPLLDERRQRRALDELHHDERRPVILVDVVNRADTRMVQGGRKACFTTEALERVVIGEQPGRKKLERHFTAEQQILGAINDTHASAAELAQHAIVRNRPPEHGENGTMAVRLAEVNCSWLRSRRDGGTFTLPCLI